jgi:hypothetical protein
MPAASRCSRSRFTSCSVCLTRSTGNTRSVALFPFPIVFSMGSRYGWIGTSRTRDRVFVVVSSPVFMSVEAWTLMCGRAAFSRTSLRPPPRCASRPSRPREAAGSAELFPARPSTPPTSEVPRFPSVPSTFSIPSGQRKGVSFSDARGSVLQTLNSAWWRSSARSTMH